MTKIAFERMSVDDAVDRYRLDGLPRPRVDEARVVSAPVVKPGDFRIDADEETGDLLFGGLWVFLGGLTVQGDLTNAEFESGPSVAVRGALEVGCWWLTGACFKIWGDLRVHKLLIAEHFRGSLRVTGDATGPVAIIYRHDTVFERGFSGPIVDRTTGAEVLDARVVTRGRVDLEAAWKLAHTPTPLVTPSAS